MTTQEIVSKLWNLCNVLRDDGITYHQYVTELTYILFLKMAKETGAEKQIPEGYRWDVLKSKSGVELKKFIRVPQLILRSRRTSRKLLRRLMDLIGFQLVKRGWAIFMRDYWRKMRTKRNPEQVSILHLESLLM